MTRTRDRSVGMLTVIVFFLSNCLPALLSFATGDISQTFHRQTSADKKSMVLPLSLSYPNSLQSHSTNGVHRKLQNLEHNYSRNARMWLYDDLLRNGYYTTRLWIGTPPHVYALIVDTGSTVTYVPCAGCKQCGKHQDPKFNPQKSSTYQPVQCRKNCNCESQRNQCTYERSYAEMSSSSGFLGEDVVSFGKESELVPQRAVFGCENMETGDLYKQHADGIMGLGRGELSIVDQLVNRGVISYSFSLCYGGMDLGGGAMVLGRIPHPPGMVFAHSDPSRSPYYNIELMGIHVAGKPLQLDPRIFDGKYGTVLDSGTTYAYLPQQAYAAFISAIMNETRSLKRIHGPDPNYDDICFSGAGRDALQLSKSFPAVDIVFSNGQKLALFPENYLFRHTKARGAYCLGIFKNGNDDTTLLGGIIVRNTLVTYDGENEKIGFWKTNCSELWKRLHIPGAPEPASMQSFGGNMSAEVSPSLAPIGSVESFFLGKFRVGCITFNTSFVNLSNPRLNLTELSEFIAHELEVNTSQVQLLNFTRGANNSLISWAIFPKEPSKYFSDVTVMSIIIHLKEHMQIPQKFGSYKLVGWNVEPQQQTWWQQHFSVMVVGAVASLVLAVSVFGIWVAWRRRCQKSGAYKPIGDIIPEQELQPLQN